MAETQDATDGYMGEFHLHNGSIMYELVEVKSFKLPEPGTREQVEKTHLKSAGRRREYIKTFFEDSEFDVVVNARLMSDTDTLLAAARDDDDPRAFKAVIPEDGVPVAQIEGTADCIGYDRGRIENGVLMEATATFRVVTIDAIEPYVG